MYYAKGRWQQPMLEKYYNKLKPPGISSNFRELPGSDEYYGEEFAKISKEDRRPLKDLLGLSDNWPSTSALAVEAETVNKAFSADEAESADEAAQPKRRGSF